MNKTFSLSYRKVAIVYAERDDEINLFLGGCGGDASE